MQMYMKGGEYAGERYFEKETVEEFTKCQFCEDENRRGAGFDKAALPEQEVGLLAIVVHHQQLLVILALPEPWHG